MLAIDFAVCAVNCTFALTLMMLFIKTRELILYCVTVLAAHFFLILKKGSMFMQLKSYACDIPHEENYCKELTPNFLESLLLLHGLELPCREEGEPLHYLELGYGQGMSFNVHAATNIGEFWGTDCDPNSCNYGRTVMRNAGTSGHMLNDSFEELARKAQNGLLPQFDMIVLHGVWSWVTSESREQVLQIISSNLKVGGLVYVSYNCMPGWADFSPLRELLTYHAQSQDDMRNPVSKVQEAYGFVAQLEQAGAMIFTRNPSAAHKFKNLASKTVAHMAHEYFNEDWYVPYFKDVATAFEKAKCTFVTSTRLLNQRPFALPPESVPLLQSIEDVKLRETVRDYILNTQFRSDIFVKGTTNVVSNEYQVLRKTFALCVQASAVSYTVNVPSGQLTLKQELYEPLVEFLASEGYSPKSILQIRNLAAYTELEFPAILEIISVMLGAGYIHPTQTVTPEVLTRTKRLNAYICSKTLSGLSPMVLASPVLGGGVPVLPMEQLFLYAMKNGHKSMKAQAQFVQSVLQNQGRTVKKGDADLSDKEILASIMESASEFNKKRLPLLQALQVDIEKNN